MKEKVYCCRYAHCKFADKKLPANKMILSKGLYYHRECFAERENINKIIKLYVEIIDPSVVVKQLRGAINNIVFDKNVDSGYLLFALQYNLKMRIKNIKSPYGLHYLINDRRFKEAYDRYKDEKNSVSVKLPYDNISISSTTFKSKPPNKKGFNKILK